MWCSTSNIANDDIVVGEGNTEATPELSPGPAAAVTYEDRKRKALAVVRRNAYDLTTPSIMSFRGDRDVVLEAVKQDGELLGFASAELRGDKDVVLVAVKQNWEALQWAHPDLRAQRDVLLTALKQDGYALQFASEELRADRDVVLFAVRRAGYALSWASQELRADREVVLAAVERDGTALHAASMELRAERTVALRAVQDRGQALQLASEELRADKGIVQTAVEQSGLSLEWASQELRADREVVLAAAKQNGCALGYASDELRSEKAFVLEVVKASAYGLQEASAECQSDKDLVLLAVRSWRKPCHLPPELEALWTSHEVQEAKKSCLAVQGEEAPVVTVQMVQHLGSATCDETAGGAALRCEATLMSGKSFQCYIHSETSHPPTLNDLASELVATLQQDLEVPASRVFINFTVDEDGEVVAATPWDWERPLFDLLPVQIRGSPGTTGLTPR